MRRVDVSIVNACYTGLNEILKKSITVSKAIENHLSMGLQPGIHVGGFVTLRHCFTNMDILTLWGHRSIDKGVYSSNNYGI